ncbi:hypothetical protein YT1_4877 [Rhodococcus ruber]|nr:hypothetical protein YT1_4877 [Rhodococcus ruber]
MPVPCSAARSRFCAVHGARPGCVLLRRFREDLLKNSGDGRSDARVEFFRKSSQNGPGCHRVQLPGSDPNKVHRLTGRSAAPAPAVVRVPTRGP